MPVLLMMFFILLVFRSDPFVGPSSSRSSLYNGAIIGEALRAGIVALPQGPARGGARDRACSSSRPRFSIEFPQAFRHMLPIIIAQLVVLLKDTSLGYIVGYQELIRRGRLVSRVLRSRSVRCSRVFVVITAIYLAINLTRLRDRAAASARRSDRSRRPAARRDDPTATDPCAGRPRRSRAQQRLGD